MIIDNVHVTTVVDIGTYELRMGQNIFPTPRTVHPTLAVSSDDSLGIPLRVGPEALAMNTKQPLIDVYSDVATLAHVITRKYDVDGHAHPMVLLHEPSEALLVAIFDATRFIDSVAIIRPSVAHLFAAGQCSGVVVDSGFSRTRVTTVYEGYALTKAQSFLPAAGHQVSESLQRMLQQLQVGYDSTTAPWAPRGPFWDSRRLHDLKIAFLECFERKPQWPFTEAVKTKTREATLPDGSTLTLGNLSGQLLMESFFSPESSVQDLAHRVGLTLPPLPVGGPFTLPQIGQLKLPLGRGLPLRRRASTGSLSGWILAIYHRTLPLLTRFWV